MDVISISYWHALNLAKPILWTYPLEKIIDHLLINGLIVKINTGDAAHAAAFKAYVASAHPQAMATYFRMLQKHDESGQDNWLFSMNLTE